MDSEEDWNWLRVQIETKLTDNWKRVTDRTWFQLMCCAHSYDMWVCPIISGWLSETRVRQVSDRSQRREVSREITQKNAEYSDNARGMQIRQINTIIRLVCIKGHMGFKYRSFGEQGGSGRNGFRDWGGAQVWRSKGYHRIQEGEEHKGTLYM